MHRVSIVWGRTRALALLVLPAFFLLPGPARAQETNQPASSARPRIGLVLGGGGALGFAHIGVLRELEKMHVPIDYIGGTSMGAIIAGFYASGMSPDEIQYTMEHIDWWDALKDRTPRRDLQYRRKEESMRYLFNLELGLCKGRLKMPKGLVAGQKLNYILQTATLSAAGITDFNRLNIPYRAVATDLQTGEEVVLDHGSLAWAMRASMAVPSLFTPVELDGRSLVDGGLVDNIPVHVVREMGADIIIAVDVVGAGVEAQRRQLASAVDIASQTYNILKRPAELAQLAKADVVITPDLGRFSSGEFHRAKDIIPPGERAAQAACQQLAAYSVDDASFREYTARQRCSQQQPIHVSSILVSGNRRVDERCIRAQIRTQPNQALDFAVLQNDLSRLYGLNDFELVTYHLLPRPDGTYDLEYEIAEKPWGPNYVHMGLRLESDFDKHTYFNLLVNYTATRLNRLGAEWRNDFELGQTQGVLTEFYQPLDYANRFFVAPALEYRSALDDYFDGDERIAQYDVTLDTARLDLGWQWTPYSETRIGVLTGHGKADVLTGPTNQPRVSADLGAWTARFGADRLDNPNFPNLGYFVDVQGMISRKYLGADDEYESAVFLYEHYFTRNGHTISYRLHGGSSFGKELPVYAQFSEGGLHSFPGYAEGQLRGTYVGIGQLSYRRRFAQLPPSLGEGVYAGASVTAGNVWNESADIGFDDLQYSASVGVGADTVLGPLLIVYARAEQGNEQYYFSLGTSF